MAPAAAAPCAAALGPAGWPRVGASAHSWPAGAALADAGPASWLQLQRSSAPAAALALPSTPLALAPSRGHSGGDSSGAAATVRAVAPADRPAAAAAAAATSRSLRTSESDAGEAKRANGQRGKPNGKANKFGQTRKHRAANCTTR